MLVTVWADKDALKDERLGEDRKRTRNQCQAGEVNLIILEEGKGVES